MTEPEMLDLKKDLGEINEKWNRARANADAALNSLKLAAAQIHAARMGLKMAGESRSKLNQIQKDLDGEMAFLRASHFLLD